MNTNEKAYKILDSIDCERKVFDLAKGKVSLMFLFQRKMERK